MKYQVVMNKEGGDGWWSEVTKSAEGVCFGSLGDISQLALHKYSPEDLKGVRVQLTNDPRIKAWPKGKLTELKRIHDLVMGRWTDGIIEYEGDADTPKSVLYPASCPVYLMIASASFWRMYSNYSNYVDNWNALDQYGGKAGEMSGLIRHFLSHGMGAGGSSDNNTVGKLAPYFAKAKAKKLYTAPIGNTGHAPFEQNLCEITTLCHLHLIDQQYLLDNLPSLYDQMKTKHRITYAGRDGWWYAPRDFKVPGFTRPNTSHSHGASIGLQQVDPKYKKKVGKEPKTNSYMYTYGHSSNYSILIEDYIEGFIKINDEVQSFVKSWT
jgi:hypothetical protein